jgi:hypothetical protein
MENLLEKRYKNPVRNYQFSGERKKRPEVEFGAPGLILIFSIARGEVDHANPFQAWVQVFSAESLMSGVRQVGVAVFWRPLQVRL